MALKQDELSLNWQPNKKMKIKEIMNIAINEIKCCPNESKLILFCRDGVQRMVDIFSETITMRYIGSLNFNHLIRGCLSTDGKFLFAGSEDSIVHCWNVNTGERIYTYNNLPFRGSIASITYHPHMDIIAISGLNARTISVCLYKHYRDLPSPSKLALNFSDSSYSQQQPLQRTSTSTQQLVSKTPKASVVTTNETGHATVTTAERTALTKIKPELKKSHTIDHSANTPARTANQKVQKAMRKLAIRLSFNEKS